MSRGAMLEDARAAGRESLDERAGKRLLAEYGVTVPKSTVLRDATGAAALTGLDYPVVVKIMSPDILHKSDAGGVKVGLKTAAEVAAAIETMSAMPAIRAARVEGYLVEEMAPPGQEMVVGGLHDAQFGPLIMVGLGGIFVEVLGDVAFRICPITRLDAEEMLAELKGGAILDGARGRAPVDKAAIVDVLLKVGGDGGLLMTHGAVIREADINPLIVSATGAVAADARFLLASA